MPSSSAASTAQIAVTLAILVSIGFASPGSETLLAGPYQSGIIRVSQKFDTPTRISGRMASHGGGSLPPSTRCGSLRRLVP
ncbi:hypothetical protein D3C81_1962800 [compost metagenome]